MNFTKKRIWLTVLAVLAVTLVCASFARNGKNPVSNAVNTVITPVQTGILKITHPIGQFLGYISQSKETKLENEELKAENIKLLAKTADSSELRKENERLKKLLDIADEMEGSITVAAKVVAYEPSNWFSYITINKGKTSGIKVSDPVITSEGVLGQVSEVGENWAKISTVINSESSVGVRIVRNGEIGIVEGESRLSKTNKCKLSYLAENASVIAGDILETSGLGGIYPRGIYIGTVKQVISTKNITDR